jgi:two-component system, NtrC family, response regulator AtoC
MSRILIATGDSSLRKELLGTCRALPGPTDAVDTVEEGVRRLKEQDYDLVLTDLHLRDGVGFELFDEVRGGGRIVVVGKDPLLEAARRVLEHPGLTYLRIPVDHARLEGLLGESDPEGGLEARMRAWKEGMEVGRCGPLVGRSPVMKEVYRRLAVAGPRTATVLIVGESGSGKELAASALHDLSPRRAGPFVAINCGAISPTLMESELFGHERGSFTGATRTHRGYFEQADGGSLFLDEITEMPADLQVKLLRILETSQVVRVGAERERRVDVRILAATNRRPEEAIAEGKLRKDLYYRLKVLSVELPPLRERLGDVPLLAWHFLDEVIQREGERRELSDAAMEALEKHLWPGNARELRNAIYTAYLLSDDVIGTEHLPRTVTDEEMLFGEGGQGLPLRVGGTIKEMERRLILSTLRQVDGSKTRAAEVLGVSVKTVYNRLSEWDMMGTQPADS